MTLCGGRCGRLRCLLNDQLIASIKLAFFWKYKTNEQLFLLLFTLTLETSDKTKLHSQKFQKIVLHPSEILRFKSKTPGKFYIIFLITPRNSMLFLMNPQKFHLLFLQYPQKFHILCTPFPHTSCFHFFWSSPLLILDTVVVE